MSWQSCPWTDNEYVGARLRTIASRRPVSKGRKRLGLDGISISVIFDGAAGYHSRLICQRAVSDRRRRSDATMVRHQFLGLERHNRGGERCENIDAVSPHVKKRVATRAPSLIAGSSRAVRWLPLFGRKQGSHQTSAHYQRGIMQPAPTVVFVPPGC